MDRLFFAAFAVFVSVILMVIIIEYFPEEYQYLSGLVLVLGGLAALWNIFVLVLRSVKRKK